MTMLHTRRNKALAWIATITILVGAASALTWQLGLGRDAEPAPVATSTPHGTETVAATPATPSPAPATATAISTPTVVRETPQATPEPPAATATPEPVVTPEPPRAAPAATATPEPTPTPQATPEPVVTAPAATATPEPTPTPQATPEPVGDADWWADVNLEYWTELASTLPSFPKGDGYATSAAPFPVLAGAPPPFAHPDGPQGDREVWTDAASGALIMRVRNEPGVLLKIPLDGRENSWFADPWPSLVETLAAAAAEAAADAEDARLQAAQDARAAERATRLQGLMDRYNALPTLPAAGGHATTHAPFPVLAGAPPPFAHPNGPQGTHEHWTDTASGQLMHRFMREPGVIHRGPLGGPYNQQLRDPQRGLGEYDPAYCRPLRRSGLTCIVGEDDPDAPWPGAPSQLTERPHFGGIAAAVDPAWAVHLGLDLPRADRGIGFVPPLQAGVNVRWYGTPPSDPLSYDPIGFPDESLPDPRNASCPHVVRLDILNTGWGWEWGFGLSGLPRELWPAGYEPVQPTGDDLSGLMVPITLENSYSLTNTPYGWVIRFPGETTHHAADTSPGGSAEPYWPNHWGLRYRWAAFDPWVTPANLTTAVYVLARDGVASWAPGSYYRVTCSDRAVTPEGLAFPATWPAPGEFSAPLTPGTQVVWWGGGTDDDPDADPRWQDRTRWRQSITAAALHDAGCAAPTLIEHYRPGDATGDPMREHYAGVTGFVPSWKTGQDWDRLGLRNAPLSPWRITCGTP